MSKSCLFSGQQYLKIGVALLQCGSATLEMGIAVVQWNFADLAKPEPSLFD